MLLEINKRLIRELEMHLKFDDGTDKHAILTEGNIYTISYFESGKLKTITGKLSSINVYNKKDIFIILDCSDENDSNIIKINVDLIRDIYVEPIMSNGVFYSFDIPIEDSISIDVSYGKCKSDATLSYNTSDIYPAMLNKLLDKKAIYVEDNTLLQLDFDIDILDGTKYSLATNYTIDHRVNDETIDLVDKDMNKFERIKIPFTIYKLYCRLTEEEEWSDTIVLPVITGEETLREQLSELLGIDPDRLNREYGYLFKFEPVEENTVHKYYISFYRDTICLGTERLAINYL